jgi:hypothetical protein
MTLGALGPPLPCPQRIIACTMRRNESVSQGEAS